MPRGWNWNVIIRNRISWRGNALRMCNAHTIYTRTCFQITRTTAKHTLKRWPLVLFRYSKSRSKRREKTSRRLMTPSNDLPAEIRLQSRKFKRHRVSQARRECHTSIFNLSYLLLLAACLETPTQNGASAVLTASR